MANRHIGKLVGRVHNPIRAGRKGKPAARRGRKAHEPPSEAVGLPKRHLAQHAMLEAVCCTYLLLPNAHAAPA